MPPVVRPVTAPEPIFRAQNAPDRQRMVRAFARLYTDAKIIFAVRVVIVFALALASSVVAFANPNLRTVVGGIGGVLLLVASFAVGSVEKWLRVRAAATQETFDTEVFGMQWNDMHADRPSQAVVARAAERYKGSRDTDWYGDTQDTHHPFAVLICQSSNLGWGAAMHRIWAWILVSGALFIAGVILLVIWLTGLPLSDALTALIIPWLGPFKEVAEQVKANVETAKIKELTEAKIGGLWSEALDNAKPVTQPDLRSVQDKILLLRQNNPYIPDWLDGAFRERNETAMRATVADKVAQARRHGHSG